MAWASNNRYQNNNTFDGDFKEDFNQGMLRMLSQGSSNDVKIILSDGEIIANKDVLAAQCEYFAANFRWKERTQEGFNHIDNTDCSKEVMERIIKYLFTGFIKFKDLGLLQLLELLNQAMKLLLSGFLQDFIAEYIENDVLSIETLRENILDRTMPIEIIRGFQYLDRYAIDDDIKSCIIRGLVVLIPPISQDNGAISAFSTLPCHLVEELFSQWSRSTRANASPGLQTIYSSAQLRCFLAWYNQNKDICQEDKKKILGTIDLDALPATDLFQLVKPSGLFPDDEVDKRILDCLRERDELKNLTAN